MTGLWDNTFVRQGVTVAGLLVLWEIFGRAGQVVNFRLVYDKETGRPKGFGFLEYTDVDAAAAAVRNLNEFELNGRTLRVDYSNDNDKGNRTGGAGDFDGGGRPPPPAPAPCPTAAR